MRGQSWIGNSSGYSGNWIGASENDRYLGVREHFYIYIRCIIKLLFVLYICTSRSYPWSESHV